MVAVALVGFQFLMVRLKAVSVAVPAPSVYISIPYGSIKSSCSVSLGALCHISIPYGSIKSHRNNKAEIGIKIIFQFLMVRLKVMPQNSVMMSLCNFNSLWFD